MLFHLLLKPPHKLSLMEEVNLTKHTAKPHRLLFNYCLKYKIELSLDNTFSVILTSLCTVNFLKRQLFKQFFLEYKRKIISWAVKCADARCL